MTQHLVLLGDSIFDNRTYTAGEPDVVSHPSGRGGLKIARAIARAAGALEEVRERSRVVAG